MRGKMIVLAVILLTITVLVFGWFWLQNLDLDQAEGIANGLQ